ncbi:cellulose binding domain-containing protein [Gordoniibacillus kamchatkensis]|uniref:cellulose binding domain-containing protein n=1 Tax=Gordoniibacillus kamchatkensis TaxID=1590651 RepID=UPI000697FF2D|nr:cellulose binding domain-containing protein [Paenibacillus sp. VKM B-2647]
MFVRFNKIRLRLPAAFMACVLMLSVFGLFGPANSAAAEVSIETSAEALPATVSPGSSTVVNVNVKSPENLSVLVDLEIFDASLKKVAQMFKDNVNVTAGEQTTVPFTWSVPANLPQGSYIVSLGIFGAGWNGQYKWQAGAAKINVSGGGSSAPGFTSSAAATPSSLAPGNSVGIDATVTASVYAEALVDVNVIRPDGVKALVQTFAQTFEAAQAKHFPASWAVPQDAPAGPYKVEIDVLKPDRTQTYHVNADAGQFTVASSTSGSKIKVSVKTNSNASTQQPSPGLEITNVSNEPLNLSDMKARYYFTIDGEKPLAVDFWTTTAKANVTARFVKMPVPSASADYYLEIGFTAAAGTLAPNAKVGVYTWFNKQDWSSFNQTDDYSFTNSSAVQDSVKSTGYLSGHLNWGAEPALLDIPPYPSNLTAAAADTSIAVTWDAVVDATGYDVEADGRLIENLTESRYTDSWLRPGTWHTYKVRTKQAGKVSIWSSPLTVKTTGQQVLPAPANVKAKPAETAVTVTWDRLTEAVTGYDIEVDGTVTDVSTNTTYQHSGLVSGSQHSYRVRAKDGGTLGPWSDLIKANTIFVPTGPFTVNFQVDTSADRAPISPYIYGTNEDLAGIDKWGARRIGGNRMSTYNWENNASNAGADYFNRSDNYIPWYYGGVPWGGNMDEPGVGVAGFHRKSLEKGSLHPGDAADGRVCGKR